MDGISRVQQPQTTPRAPSIGTRLESAVFGDDGFSFGDVLDVVNPLQHIPIVATIYREISNDEIAAGPQLLGSTLFGGWLGAGGATLNLAIEQFTGRDVGELVMAMFRDGPPATEAPNAASPSANSPIGEALQHAPTRSDGDDGGRSPEPISEAELRANLLTEARSRQATPRAGLWEEIERVLARNQPRTGLDWTA